MNKNIIKGIILISAISLIGCGSSDVTDIVKEEITQIEEETFETLEENTNDILDDLNPSKELSQEMKDSISHMYAEEGLAYELYLNLYKVHPLNQLKNIAENSEINHIESVNILAIKYDLNTTQYPDTDNPYDVTDLNKFSSGDYPVEVIQDLYTLLYDKGISSEVDALQVGCMVEVVDIKDLQEYITIAERDKEEDILKTFNQLLQGSYNHYWTFDQALINKGVTQGCCSFDQEYCHPEYPKN